MTDSSLIRSPSAPAVERGRGPFARFAAGVAFYTLLVILFGAVVRITGSGAGCGQHWPSCNGQVLELPKTLKSVIEYTHRVSSGLTLPAIAALCFWAVRLRPRPPRVLGAALVALLLVLVEAWIGRVLVRSALVENDASALRAVVMPAHLLNTSALMASLGLAAFWARLGEVRPARWSLGTRLCLAIGLFAYLATAASGALTALGDTVYPMRASWAHLAAPGRGTHFLERLRAVHPVLAMLSGAYYLYLGRVLAPDDAPPLIRKLGRLLLLLTLAQLGLGLLNVALSAPGPLQVVHLAVANAVWLTLVLCTAAAREGV